ncbi:MAG TPA: hypothetical protein VHF45_05175 [Thermoleophilaceae bacterium]|nr:hypothetical protein [Thermoleophilaceae bacterium]
MPQEATAFAHRNELFLLKHAVVVDGDASTADREAARGWLRRSWASVHPWGSGGVYPNSRTWTSRTSHLLTTGGTTTACCG